MHRVDTSTAAAALPADEADGVQGYFTKGDPAGGTPATVPGQDWCNAVQEELIALLTDAGIVPAKATKTQVRDSIRTMIGNNTDINPIINGGCIVGQNTGGRASKNLSITRKLGGVDRWGVWASGGAVSAGTIEQEATNLLGDSGYACSALGVTLTGAGALSWSYRMESADALQYKNLASIMASLNVEHDIGADVDYTIVVNKANVQDDFSAVTQIAASGNIAVQTDTDTVISLALAPGDCSNGIEILITASCGAIAAKNLRATQLQTRTGTYLKAFRQKTLAEESRACSRYFQYVSAACIQNSYNSPVTLQIGTSFARMRVVPTLSGGTDTTSKIGSLSWTNILDHFAEITGTTTASGVIIFRRLNALADAEL